MLIFGKIKLDKMLSKVPLRFTLILSLFPGSCQGLPVLPLRKSGPGWEQSRVPWVLITSTWRPPGQTLEAYPGLDFRMLPRGNAPNFPILQKEA